MYGNGVVLSLSLDVAKTNVWRMKYGGFYRLHASINCYFTCMRLFLPLVFIQLQFNSCIISFCFFTFCELS